MKMHANERKIKGHECTLHWNENERNMKNYEGTQSGKIQNERKMHANECETKGT